MTQTFENAPTTQPPPVRLSRIIAAPRETVFKAWCATEHVRRWFAPSGYAVPHAQVHMRTGGAFEVCMRAPDGLEHWTRGTFAEISPHDRLVLDLRAEDDHGRVLFHAYTEVDFADAPGGTRVEVVQTYTVLDPDAAPMIGGAPIGWGQTLDNLQAEVARMRDEATVRSVVHATFHLERTYDAPVARVFRALSDQAAKSRWFGGDDGQLQLIERSMDFRVGGRERLRGRWGGGMVSTFDAVYYDIIPQERIVYAYEMHQDDRKISVSLATLQLKPAGAGRTTLTVTEQGAFLDGYDDAGSREEGTGVLLDRLGASLRD